MKIKNLILIFLISINVNAQYEIVDDNDFLINGKLSIFPKKEKLREFMGDNIIIKPIDMAMECGFEEEIKKGGNFFTYTKKGISYFVYPKGTNLEFVDLEKTNNFILYKKIKLSNKTTLKELKKIFPLSYQSFEKEKTKINDNSCILILKFNQKWDDELRIHIIKNKVIGFSYYYPC